MKIVKRKMAELEAEAPRIIIRKVDPPQRALSSATFVSVDPGVDGTGWALFLPKTLEPVASGAVSVGRSGDWGWRAMETARLVHKEVLAAFYDARSYNHASIKQVFIEEPQFMEGGRGIVAARSGDLVKLCLLAGMVGGEFASADVAMRVHYILVREWKGSMPKDVTARRVMSKLKGWKPTTETTHEMDAVGLGLFVKGAL